MRYLLRIQQYPVNNTYNMFTIKVSSIQILYEIKNFRWTLMSTFSCFQIWITLWSGYSWCPLQFEWQTTWVWNWIRWKKQNHFRFCGSKLWPAPKGNIFRHCNRLHWLAGKDGLIFSFSLFLTIVGFDFAHKTWPVCTRFSNLWMVPLVIIFLEIKFSEKKE